jgi:surface carbohydrate biosynthesis protein
MSIFLVKQLYLKNKMQIVKKNIYIPIEIYFRELIPRLYFSSKAIKKNYRIYIGTKHGIDKILQKKKSLKSHGGIYFNKGIFIANKKYLEKIKDICDNFVVMDEELGPSIPSQSTAVVNRCVFDSSIKKFFTVGKNWKKNILQHDKRFKPIVVNTGWPRYDLLNDKKVVFYLNEAKKIKKKYGKFHLFSSNYGTLSYEGLAERMRIIKRDHTKSFCIKKKKIFKNNISDFNEFIKELNFYYANKGKNKIIIRPHPSEFYHEDWARSTRNISKNISVIYKGDVIPWIMASEGLIHRGCGTSIDGYILKKNVFYFQSKRKLNKEEKNLTFKVSRVINNLIEIENKTPHLMQKYDAIKDDIQNYNNKNSSNKILNEINKLKTQKEYPIKADTKILLFYFFIKRLLKSIFIKNESTKMPLNIKVKDVKYFFNNIKNNDSIKIKRINSEAIEIDSI